MTETAPHKPTWCIERLSKHHDRRLFVSGKVLLGTVNPESQAILTCSSDCATGDTFTLYYTASVPNGDPSGFGDVRYRLGFDGGLASSLLLTASAEVVGFSDDDPGLVLSGVIGSSSAVPVPAAVWLFGSGLLGLIGLARRKT